MPKSSEKDPDLVQFGERLRELRKRAELSQEGLARESGLHWTFVGQVERGTRNPSLKNVLRLARGLGVDPAELFRDD